jgi:hypothetical protein
LSLGVSRTSDTVSSMSFAEPLVRPSSAIDYARPMPSIPASQFEREVCKYILKFFFFLISLHYFNIANCFRCASQSCKICGDLENGTLSS